MELHQGVRAMKDEISKLQEENANKVKGEGVVAAVAVTLTHRLTGCGPFIALSSANEATGTVAEESERHHTSFPGNRQQIF